MSTLPEYRFRYSFPNSPPSDPPSAKLRSIDRSRSEHRPRRDDQQPQIASSSPISTSAQSAIQPRPRTVQQRTTSPQRTTSSSSQAPRQQTGPTPWISHRGQRPSRPATSKCPDPPAIVNRWVRPIQIQPSIHKSRRTDSSRCRLNSTASQQNLDLASHQPISVFSRSTASI
ncbi:hypothetical protein ACLOJK_023136 [Asimina triloba]